MMTRLATNNFITLSWFWAYQVRLAHTWCWIGRAVTITRHQHGCMYTNTSRPENRGTARLAARVTRWCRSFLARKS
jgi:hypothetical protein